MKTMLLAAALIGVNGFSASTHNIVIKYKNNILSLDNSLPKSFNELKELSDCINWEWSQGRLTNAQALVLLSRVTKYDRVRIPGRPLSFHGDSWTSYGHWSINLKQIIYIIVTATGDEKNRATIEGQIVDAGLGTMSDGYIHYDKKKLTKIQQNNLILLLNQLELKWADTPEFQQFQKNPIAPSNKECPLKILKY